MLKVVWPSAVATRGEVWRVLDLSGLTKSVRESENFLKAGYVWLDDNHILSLRDTVELGRLFRLEIRFPNGVVRARNIMLVRPTRYKPRNNYPDTAYRKP